MMDQKNKSTLDFYEIKQKHPKVNCTEVYPDYTIEEDIKDLMVRGGSFYAVWDPDKQMWNRKETSVKRIVDRDVRKTIDAIHELDPTTDVREKLLKNNSSGKWAEFKNYIKNLPDTYRRLDEKVTFQDPNDAHIPVDYKGKRLTDPSDNVSRFLPYSIQMNSECPAWDELISTLYDPEERDKIEWAIGSVISGDSKRIQKFLVLYGKQGTGKGTILSIIEKMFDGYCSTFKAENLVHSGDNFNLDFLSEDPLIAIDADTNLSRIESNVLINQIVSHERIKVNEKFKNKYPNKPICMLILGTNQQVKITDAKSGIIRRLIDVEPSERLIPEDHYFELMDRIEYEFGAIAGHCLKVYQELGRTYYTDYIPVRMMYRTDPFFNFMEETVSVFMKGQKDDIAEGSDISEGITADNIWSMWKAYCSDSGIDHIRKRFEIIDEAKNYFRNYEKGPVRRKLKDGMISSVRSWFSGFRFEKFNQGDSEQSESRRERKLKGRTKKDISKDSESESVDAYGWLVFDCTESLLDKELADCPAQYARKSNGLPRYPWNKVGTKLKDLDTSELHWVKGPGKLIFVDYDKHGPDGKKDLALNMRAAVESGLPKTYSEVSNSGGGIHSYYWYDGNVDDLSGLFAPEIEVKKFPEDKDLSIRRRVWKCNSLPIAHISSGLPFKEKKKVINWEGVKDEKHLRNLVIKAIDRNIRPYGEEPKTITLVKYICDLLRDAQSSGMKYDLSDLDNVLYSFAASSHHNKDECINLYYGMELRWPKEIISEKPETYQPYPDDSPIIILDCEVTRNLLLVIYKELEPDGVAAVLKSPINRQKKCVRLFNPKPHEIAGLFGMKIVGHNVTGYDNHILYAAYLGYSPEKIFEISQDIIVRGNRSPFREARSISYTDTLDVASEKKGLKKIEIDMHIPHKEMEIDCSKPLPESEWERLAQYCENDVLATEAYFLSKKWQTDFKARKILAALTGMTVNDSTNNLVAQLVFGNVRDPQGQFNYPDLKKEFPQYSFENGRSYYRETIEVGKDKDFQKALEDIRCNTKEYRVISWDEAKRRIEVDAIIGEGGRVYAEPGMYYDVITFDVTSMHPTSIIVENGFGPYTKGYQDLYEARVAIKNGDYDKARKLFDGRLAPYLENDDDADDLAYALKIALNSTYGVTAAKFQNRFKDPRNIDNWVAKRGALFMEKLRLEVQKRGGHVIHIKTDSIKLVQPSEELKDFVLQFARDHGYEFKIESKYERICLVNHAVYIALRSRDDEDWLKECKKARKAAEEHGTPYYEPTRWTATGAQFAHPFVFKQLFSKERMDFWDFCELKTVQTALYLDVNEKLKNVEPEEKEKKKIQARIKKLIKEFERPDISREDEVKINDEITDLQKDISVLNEVIQEGHKYLFVGKAGEFIPVRPGCDGGLLVRKESDSDNYGYATGAKGYRWIESEYLKDNLDWKKYVDIRYFRGLTDVAIETIGQFGDFEMFVHGDDISEDRVWQDDFDDSPWILPCKTEAYAFCSDCPDFVTDETGYSCKKGYDITNQILETTK